MNQSPRKARNTAIGAFCLGLFFFVFTLVFGAFTEVLAMYLLSWQILAGLLVWAVLIVQFHQRLLAEQEKMDMTQLSRSAQQGTIFTGGADRLAMLAVAQKRLAFFEKWIIPSAAVVIAVYQIVMGLLLFQYKVLGPVDWRNKNPLLGAVLMIVVSFVSFLFSRYATGMSSEKDWKPLRAGGSYLLLTAVLGFALAVSLALSQFKYPQGLVILSYLIPWLLVVLGAEILLNAVLDIYRPRIAGEYSRAAYDSRLIGLINEPGGILRTVAHTIDYQFGFKVSQTWFYRLLERAILPLILFAALTLYLMSSFAVVGPGQAAVVEYFGSPVRDLEPGLHLKWPWPIEKVYVFPTDQIQQITIGYKEGEKDKAKKAFLWGEKHYEEEYNLLVAVETDTVRDKGAVPVSVVQANIPIQYRISNLRQFMYKHKEARQLLEAICYRELTRFAVSAKIETDDGSASALPKDRKSLLGAGRMEASQELHQRIQAAADEAQLGVEIVLLGLQGVHPPPEVAKEYEEVVASVQQKQAAILSAQAEKNKVLTELGGSIADVDALYDLAMEFERAKAQADEPKIQELRQELQAAFVKVRGKVFSTLRQAESDAFERIHLAKGEGLRFAGQIQGYQASPLIYKKLQRLMMLEEALEKARKYVVVAEKDDAQVYIVDLQEKLAASLYDLDLGLEEPKK
ncbi:MAG: hypothetical protein KBI46_03695 [Phycisphaerae bacterium]|nr:hypothetical protein [Phycisphaerae bacterium]